MSVRYPKPGTVLLGKYRVESVIGEGGMGGVIKAWHLDLEEPVALKILLPEMMDKPLIVARFTREAKAAVKLKGEHVARVLDVGKLEGDADGEFEGVPYIAMEYLEGADLNQIIKAHGPQEPAVAADLMLQACEAIAEAHSIGIIHRDIKASNFFITQIEDQPPQLKVLDFGIATPPKGTSDLTDGEAVIGTPSYMAPEQMRSSKQADARSDVWSMGVVLYEMLEGHKPFRSEAYSDLCLKVGMDPPEPMQNPAVPEALRAVVMKCLEKPVERRYQSAAELAFDLLPFASDAVAARARAEAAARLLSRRSTRAFEAYRAPDDVTPAPGPKRLTPPAVPISQPISTSNPSLTPAAGVPMIDANASGQRTPTSNGQLSLSGSQLRPSRRRAVVVASFFVAIVLAGGSVLLLSKSKPQTRPAAATPTAEPTVELKTEPVTPPPPATTPVVTTATTPDSDAGAGSAGSSATTPVVADGSAAHVTKTPPKKLPPKKIIKKSDDPFGRR